MIEVERFMQSYAQHPLVIDVRSGDRFGERVISVTVATETERAAVKGLFPSYFEGIRVDVDLLFGLGSFTSQTPEFLEIDEKMFTSPYNIYGTPENKELERQINELYEREQQLWKAMDHSQQLAEIDAAVRLCAEQGWLNFGNCWTRCSDA